MSNWQQSQQWGAPNAPFGQPQQGQGWGQQQQGGMGGWQQAAPHVPGQGFFNSHHQQPQQFPVQHHQSSFPPSQGGGGYGGFMAAGPAGGHVGIATGFPVNQGMGRGQFGGGFSQQQQQFQALQQQQQQQQMAYIQEQQRLAREEQKKRDLEIQKRKLMNINVANPTASSSLSFDDLVSSMKTSSSSSSSRSASPKVTRQTQDVAAPKSTAPVTGSGFDDPVPTQSIPTTSNNSDQWMPATAPVSSGSQPVSVSAAKQPDNTLEKLMESSLTNLQDTSPGRSRKMDFKTSSSKSGVKPSPLTSAQKTAFSESVRARAWTADGGDFSGVFAQHASQQEQQQQLQQTTDLLGGDDSFGEFQSVGAGPPAAATSLIEPLGQSQGTQLAGLLDLQPTQQQAFQGQLPHIGDGSVRAVGTAQEQPRLRAATIHGGNTIPTSTYQHPIPSTSVAEKPQSPTATQFSSLDPSKFPTVYVEVFKRCSKAGQSFLDTELLFPLLMSSQLPKNVLRDLWSVANREVPGKLNQTELFVLLGLIGLAQSGNPSPTPEDLKKASQLPIPKLSALESLPSVSAPVPSSSQSHTHARPTDDFGDFQQGQQSFQPSSFPPPPPPPSSQSLAPASDPVSLINISNSSTARPQGNSPTGGDKYGVFENLRSIGSSGETTPVPLLDIMKPSKASEMIPQLPLATTTTAPSASVVPPPPSDGGFADFASFQQAPSNSAASGVGPSAPAAPKMDNSANQGWAEFADFTSSQATSSHSFPPPPSNSTTLPVVSSSSNAAAKSKADSAFDTLLPPELLPSKAPKSAELEPKPVEATFLGSLESKPSITTTTSSTTGLDFGIFESNVSPESGKKKATKQLTGLEVLEEEFSARMSAKVTSPPAPLSIEKPLVPESAPLDDFGEFEAYSSPGGVEKKKSSLPPLAGVSVGEPLPSLKKTSSTDPVQVWKSCLSKCSEVLDSCVSVFSEVKEQTVLEEIAQSEEGRNKLRGIVEVYRLAKRVYQPFREKMKGAEGESCVQSIQKQWKKLVNLLPNNIMTQLYAETTPACVEEEDVLSDSISKCSLCLSSKSVSIPPHLSLDGRKEEYTSPLLFNSGQSYHSTCANFWLNVVQEELPMLT